MKFTKQGRCFFNLFTFLLFFCTSAVSQQPIAIIKAFPPGSVVTTTGTISTGDEYGTIRYLQDDNAGIALYSSSLANTKPGDSIVVTGVLSIYQGEYQISPVMSYQLISTGHDLTPFIAINLSFLSTPEYSARLLSVYCVGINTCETNFAEGPYAFYDQYSNSRKMIMNEESNLIGQPISSKPLIVTGIWTNIDGQYQMLAREVSDAAEGLCKLIPPAIVTFSNDLVYLTWNDMPIASTWLEWGVDDFNNQLGVGILGPDWTEPPPDVQQGKIYQGRLRQIHNGTDTIYSPPTLFAAPSSGPAIQVYFNHTVDNSFSDGSAPSGTIPSAIQTNVITLIDQVKQTLDVAVYNAGSTLIIDAIKRAVQRGVEVRYITDDETSNSVLEGITAFPIFYRTGDGIMHNKFMIGDVESATEAWVWTGSTNWTINQLTSDANHAYVIRDQALAMNYKREFDEMWGENLSHENSLVGENKNDNTAHLFSFNHKEIESYFSPSDEPDCHILEAISSANHHIEIALLLLTSGNLIDEIISLHHNDISVRVILEDEESSQYAVDRLREEGIPLAIHDPSSIFHHKYAIIDEGYPNSDPMVVTGSHNWTFSADHINDENTLIVHDQAFANIFRQEFEARWKELDPSATTDGSVLRFSVFPNPATTGFSFANPFENNCALSLLDINGRPVKQFIIAPHQTSQCPFGQNLSPGYYFIKAIWPDQQAVTRILIQPN